MSLKDKACPLIAIVLGLLFCVPGSAEETHLVWSTFFGGAGADECNGIATDGQGNAYLVGSTWSRDLPTTVGGFDTTHNDSCDVFVAKLDPTGSHLIYATFIGGDDYDECFDVAVDRAGNAYVTGRTFSWDFPVTCGAFDTTHGRRFDAYVAKLSSGGDVLLYATFLGGDGYDMGKSIAVDDAGNAYLTGWTMSDDFPVTRGAFGTIYLDYGEEDAFVVKLNPSGSDLVYATFLGGSNEDWGRSIAIDTSGCAYVAMLTYSEDIPTTRGAFDETNNVGREAYVAKLDPSGSVLEYGTFLGGKSQDWCQDIAVDDAGNAYLAGVTYSPNFPVTPDAWDTTHNGFTDVFVVVLNPTGSDLIYSTFLGGVGEERSTALVLDEAGDILVTGWTRSTDFPTTAGVWDGVHNGESDAFVIKFDLKQNTLAYSTFLGGISYDLGYGIATDGAGGILVTGWTQSEDFPTTTGVFDSGYNGDNDVFLTKLNLTGHR